MDDTTGANGRARAAAASDGRRLRWAEHRQQRRAAFVAAGVAAVDEHGPDASAEQIAAAAGVSRTVLYRYFRDREDLRQAIADHVVTAVVASVTPHIALTADATPRAIITSTVEVIFGWFDEHPNLYYFLRSRRNGPGADGLDAVENTLADRVCELLKLVLVLFGLDADQAEPGAFGIVGMVESVGSWWLARRTMSREKVTAVVCESIWHLLEGTARANQLAIRYDEPLPWHQLAAGANA